MFRNVRNLYQQWADGQTLLEQIQRREVFIVLVMRIYGYSREELENYLTSQAWYPKQLKD